MGLHRSHNPRGVPKQGLWYDHWDESIPSPHPSSPFYSSLILSFQEDHVESHDQAGSRHSDVEPRPNHSSWEQRWRIKKMSNEIHRWMLICKSIKSKKPKYVQCKYLDIDTFSDVLTLYCSSCHKTLAKIKVMPLTVECAKTVAHLKHTPPNFKTVQESNEDTWITQLKNIFHKHYQMI